jgi:hypothetical protein
VVVTAVLLLLSLPVLAGILLTKIELSSSVLANYPLIPAELIFIVPALNLAVCWELCYNNTQSAGNLSSLHEIGLF